jgi:hypothetical protein
MANDKVDNHLVCTRNPTIGNCIGFGYSTLKEAQGQTIALEQAGQTIVRILPTSQPMPNPPRED